MNNGTQIKFKICLIGEPGVGKTSLIGRFVHDIFEDDYLKTIGMKVTKKEIEIRNPEDNESLVVNLLIWDIMGQPGFRQILKGTYFHGASGLMAICDVTRKDTLLALSEWIKIGHEAAGEVPAVFLGNKCDLVDEQEVSLEDINTFASNYGNAPVLLTSAKTGENVEYGFKTLSKSMLKGML